MPTVTPDLPPPINHVFVDFENVHEIDPALIGSKAVNFTLLLGPRQMKLDVSLVEKLLEHAGSVYLVRLASSGRNALDFTLAYYVGRAVAADPTGKFHIVSKDAGYDPLIKHLRSNHIHASRYDSSAALPFSGSANSEKLTSKTAASKADLLLDERTAQVVEHFRKHSTTRPRSQKKRVSFLIANHGHKITEDEALSLVENLCKAGHLTIGEKGRVIYLLEPK